MAPKSSLALPGTAVAVPPTSIPRAAYHSFKSYVGIGIFLLPSAFGNGGYGIGIIVCAVLSVMVSDACAMLIRAREVACDGGGSYGLVVQHFFGLAARQAVDVGIAVAQLGWCVLYVQYCGSVAASFVEGNDRTNVYALAVAAAWAVSLAVALNTHHMARLALVSLVSIVFVMVVTAASVVLCVQKLMAQGAGPDVVAVTPAPQRWVLLIPTTLSALAGIAPMLPIYNSVEASTRFQRFPPMYTAVVLTVGALYATYGVLAYVAFGSTLTDSVATALPKDSIGTIVRVLMCACMLTSYPIQYVPAVEVLDRAAGVQRGTSPLQDNRAFAVRTASTSGVAAVSLAVGAEAAGLLLGLLGSTVAVALIFVIPPLCTLEAAKQQARNAERETRWQAREWRAAIYVAVGVCAMVLGAGLGLYSIVRTLF